MGALHRLIGGLLLLFASTVLVGAQGTGNVKLGPAALVAVTSGSWNVGIGSNALDSTTTGSVNVGVGYAPLHMNTSGSHNTAIGLQSLYWNNGWHNTAIGRDSGFSNTTGNWNTNLGTDACPGTNTGSGNTCVGGESGYGENDPATPEFDPSLNQNRGGSNNTFVGYQSSPKEGQQNLVNATALGYRAKVNKNNQVSIGNSDVTEFVLAGVTITKAQLQALLALLPPP